METRKATTTRTNGGQQAGLAETELRLPQERSHFLELLAKNPNHFGNLIASPLKPVQPMTGNTTYEQLKSIGLNPPLGLLEGTIEINLSAGYSGGICTDGSTEYVRFYVDYGTGWQDAGLAATPVHDIPNANDCAGSAEKPLSYVVSLPYQGTKMWCGEPQLPDVRGILSWNSPPPPNQPNWLPVWGNVVNQHVQIAPLQLLLSNVLGLLDKAKLAQLPAEIQQASPQPIPLPDPAPLTVTQLQDVYAVAAKGPGAAAQGKVQSVEAHRFGFTELHAALSGTAAPADIAGSMETWKAIGIDWSAAIAALESQDGDVEYEQIETLGLDITFDKLAASFRIKRPYGYSGTECQAGSKEYVAFWADWDDTCHYDYLGTTEVQVHDFPTIPVDGLEYTAILPVDLSKVRIPCELGARISRVRAVLSWATPPSTVDPNLVPYWGNIFDAHVQLKPSIPGVTTGLIDIMGGISVEDIDVTGNGMTLPGAKFALTGLPADYPWMLKRACPFGGLVVFQAIPKTGKYRITMRPAGSAITPVPLTQPFYVQPAPGYGFGHYVSPDPDGWVDYLDIYHNEDMVLGAWSTSDNTLWELRLEPQGGLPGTWLRLQLDNTAPRRKPASVPYEPPEVTCDVQITSPGGDCSDFNPSTVPSIAGTFVARADHFGGFSLITTPDTLGPPEPATPVASTTETNAFALGGSPWTLGLAGMKPCGYVIRLEVTNRSIIDSQPGTHGSNYSDVGFCIS